MATSNDRDIAALKSLRTIYESLQVVFDQAQDEEWTRGDLGGGGLPTIVGTVSQRLRSQLNRLDEVLRAMEERWAVLTAKPVELKFIADLRDDIKGAVAYVDSALDESDHSEQIVHCLGSVYELLTSAAARIDAATGTAKGEMGAWAPVAIEPAEEKSVS